MLTPPTYVDYKITISSKNKCDVKIAIFVIDGKATTFEQDFIKSITVSFRYL